MYLYLVRHAIAVPQDAPDAPDDAARPLTSRGVDRMRQNVRGLQRLDLPMDEIWTSPLVRARQTAELLAAGFPNTKVRTENALAPGGDSGRLLKRLREHATLSGIALVGHEPGLGELCTWLLSGRRLPGVQFKKGGAACVQVDDLDPPVRSTLCWLLTPAQLRGLR